MFDINSNTQFIFDDNMNNYNYIEDKVCPKCGMSLFEVQKNKIVGCANCYSVFENGIKDLVLRQQGTNIHIGKATQKRLSQSKIIEQIAKLEREKDEAVRNENFSAAEKLKQQIKKLKGEL